MMHYFVCVTEYLPVLLLTFLCALLPSDPGNMLRPESPSGHLCAEGEVALTIAGPHCCLANPGPISRSWLLGVGPQNKRTQPSSARVGRT